MRFLATAIMNVKIPLSPKEVEVRCQINNKIIMKMNKAKIVQNARQ